MPKLLAARDYALTPWKNGRGVTTDVVLLPAGASHEDFDIRVSLAPIDSEGPFSSFPGIDRHITLIEGEGLGLDFQDGTPAVRLEPFQPLFFDSVKAPVSRLAAGPVKVLNVMTRRGRWAARVDVVAQPVSLALTPGELGIVYVAQGEWEATARDGALRPAAGDTLLWESEAGAVDLRGEGRLLVARLASHR